MCKYRITFRTHQRNVRGASYLVSVKHMCLSVFLAVGLSGFILSQHRIILQYDLIKVFFHRFIDGGRHKEPGGEGRLCSVSLHPDDKQEDLPSDCDPN